MGRPSLKTRRRDDLIRACIQTIHEDGLESASLARIAKRAGLTAGIVSHYFADKAELMEATMRHIGHTLGQEQARRLRDAKTPGERITAIMTANLGAEQFRPDTSAVWLSFWARVNHSPRLARIQRINAARLTSNLRHPLRALIPDTVPDKDGEVRRIALVLSTLIDGLWLRAALENGGVDPKRTLGLALRTLEAELGHLTQRSPVPP
jgi:transcriptional repressor BetI